MKAVTVVGVGALGSHLVQFLRNEAEIKVIDFDRVEQKNILSQFHGKPSVGKLKVDALQQTMQFLYLTKVKTYSHRLVEDNIDKLLSKSDLVIDCVDNGASRKLVQDYVRKHKIPCLHGALAAAGAFGRVIWDESFAIDYEAAGAAATCEDGAFLPFIGLVSCYLSRAAQLFLQEGKKIGYSISPSGSVVIV